MASAFTHWASLSNPTAVHFFFSLPSSSPLPSSLSFFPYFCPPPFWDRVSLCIHGCSGTSVDQAGLEQEIRLPLPPSAGIKGVKGGRKIAWHVFLIIVLSIFASAYRPLVLPFLVKCLFKIFVLCLVLNWVCLSLVNCGNFYTCILHTKLFLEIGSCCLFGAGLELVLLELP